MRTGVGRPRSWTAAPSARIEAQDPPYQRAARFFPASRVSLGIIGMLPQLPAPPWMILLRQRLDGGRTLGTVGEPQRPQKAVQCVLASTAWHSSQLLLQRQLREFGLGIRGVTRCVGRMRGTTGVAARAGVAMVRPGR